MKSIWTRFLHWWDYHSEGFTIFASGVVLIPLFYLIFWLIHHFQPDIGADWTLKEATVLESNTREHYHLGKYGTGRESMTNLIIRYSFDGIVYQSALTVRGAMGSPDLAGLSGGEQIVVRVNPENPGHSAFHWEDQPPLKPRRLAKSLPSPQ